MEWPTYVRNGTQMLRDYKFQCGCMVENDKHKIEISRTTSINSGEQRDIVVGKVLKI